MPFLNKSLSELTYDEDFIVINVKAPINIALIKYWGKRDNAKNFPSNDSLSLTIDTNDIFTHTTLVMGPESKLKQDRFWLNRQEIILSGDSGKNKKIKFYCDRYRKYTNMKVCFWIVSQNNFPTAAGLASSASGFAALITCFSRLFNNPSIKYNSKENLLLTQIYSEKEISSFSSTSLFGSGSSCRSFFGGAVEWKTTVENNETLSWAQPIAKQDLFDDLKIIILVTRPNPKSVGSTEGMKLSTQTSQLLKYRVDHIVNDRLDVIKKLIKLLDNPKPNIFGTKYSDLFKIVMMESNQLQAVCRDTFPSIIYSTADSDAIINTVTLYNQIFTDCMQRSNLLSNGDADGYITTTQEQLYPVGYSFDAGPNAFIFLHNDHVKPFVNVILKRFKVNESTYKKVETKLESCTNPMAYQSQEKWTKFVEELEKTVISLCDESNQNYLCDIIITKVGTGPVILNDASSCLIDINELPNLKFVHQ